MPGEAMLGLPPGRAAGESGEDAAPLWKLVAALRGTGSPSRAASWARRGCAA